MSAAELKKLESQLNEMTRQGHFLAALEKFYDDECLFQEGNQPPRHGRAAQHEHLSGYFQSVKSFNSATLHAQSVGDDVTISEWSFDLAGYDGPFLINETVRRKWRNGKVISERYYTAG